MEEAIADYTRGPLAKPVSIPVGIASQRVQVAFADAGNDVLVELVAPDPDNQFLNHLLRKGVSFYHLGYLCSDIQKACADFIASGATELSRFHSEAFEGRECVFYLTPVGQMIELIDNPATR